MTSRGEVGSAERRSQASAANTIRIASITLPQGRGRAMATGKANVAKAVSAIRALAPHRPELICLPENFLYAELLDRDPAALAVPIEHELIERFADLAQECGALLAVPFLESVVGGDIYNSVALLDSTGTRLGVYRKQVLWPSDPGLSRLEGGVTPGSGGGPFATRFGPVAVKTCLELQFPSMWRTAGVDRARLILFPSEQGGGMALRSRAWDTRCFVVSAASKGGPSLVIDPVGYVVAQWEFDTPRPVYDLYLDYELVHLDFTEEKLRRLASRLRGRMTFTRYEQERVCLVTSLVADLAVGDVLAEHGIPTMDVYLARVSERNASLRAERSRDQSPESIGLRQVSVIVPTLGESPGLRRCLAALSKQQCDLPIEVVVVLNSGDLTLHAPPDGVRVVHEPRRGPAAARNTGVRVSNGDVIAMVDDDCEPSRWWLQAAVDALRRAGREAVVAGAITRSGADTNLVSRFDGVSYLRQEDYVRYSGAFVTANVVMHRSAFDRVGGFDESFLEAAGEDWDWAARARRIGMTVVYDEAAAVDHPCMRDLRDLRAKAERLGRGEGRLRLKNGPGLAPIGLFGEIGRQVRRARGHDTLPLGKRLGIQGLSVLVGYWMWRGRRNGLVADGTPERGSPDVHR